MAIKFYACQIVFAHERALYSNARTCLAFPDILDIWDSLEKGPLLDAAGASLPSFIVFERGETLNEWASRKKPDLVTSIQVIWHVAQCLQTLHDVGIVHRDLKPSNTLWLPSINRWRLIDVGFSAAAGAPLVDDTVMP